MQYQIQAVVTDLDGVIRFFPPERDAAVEKKYGLPLGSISALAFSSRLLLPAITGILPDELWRERIGIELKRAHPRINCALALEEWSNHPGVVEPDTLWYLRSICATVPLVLLTNATSRLEDDLRKLDILRTFDKILSSSLLGVAKPDAKAFAKTQKILNLEPAEILFIDDSMPNVEAASKVGWQAVHFENLESLKSSLKKWML